MIRWLKSRAILLVLAPVVIVGAALSMVRYVAAIPFSPHRAWRVAVATDDLANVAGNGHLGQTISSRAAYAAQAGKTWGKIVCSGLDAINPGHCKNALTARDQNLNQSSLPSPSVKH